MKFLIPLVCAVLAFTLVMLLSDKESGKASIKSDSFSINLPFGKTVQWSVIHIILYYSFTGMPDIHF